MSTSGVGPVARLPTGTVTFLLSDVEGSTRQWEEAPDAMAGAIPRHYEMINELIVEHAGVLPVEQGEGDSVVGAFSRASDAVTAALAVQLALAAEAWPAGAALRVRISVHTGEARLRGFQYLGPVLNRGARIRATGHGGQILVSATTAALVADHLPSGARLDDLGLHRLKDLGTPEHIWQLGHPDLPPVFPPLRSLDAFRHNLPVQLTPLIGRSAEISEMRDELAGQRLLTLTGSGGIGKSRLALAVAAELLDSKPGGVWWVELAPVGDPSAVGPAALVVLGGRQAAGTPIVHQLAVALGDLPSLLVLDNCEHLLDVCADLVAGLLAANPAVSVLTTSREPLAVPGEITWRVPSMRSPTADAGLDVDALAHYEAVELFVERAHRARPSFAVTAANAPAIAEICHRLDGIPLALELAAARCRQLSPERIASELQDRFRLLTGGARTVLARQRTLAASVDWSHERLDDIEQRVFRRLGVFSGAFPLEAAAAVVSSGGDVEPVAVFDLLTQLDDKGLVVVDEGRGGEPRFRMLETLRAYALERAHAAGELTALRDAHAAWWAAWLHPRGAMPTDDVLEELNEFHAELRSTLDWCAHDPPRGLRLLRDVAPAWLVLGRFEDAMPAADLLLSPDNAEQYGAEWLAAAYGSADLYWGARGFAAHRDLLAHIDAVATHLGDEYYQRMSRREFVPALRDLAGSRGDRYNEAMLTTELALNVAEDEPAVAAAYLLDAESVAEASGMRSFRDVAVIAHAELALSIGDLVRAIELTRAALSRPDLWSWWPQAVRQLGFAALLMRDADSLRLAVETADRAVRTAPGLAEYASDARHRLELLEGLSSVIAPEVFAPDVDRTFITCGRLWLVAREAIDAGAAEAAVSYAQRAVRPRPHPLAVCAAIEAAASGDESRWFDALAIAVDQGLRLIATDAFEGLALAAARTERWADCVRDLDTAQRLRDETGYRWRFGFEQRAVDHVKSIAVDALGHDRVPTPAAGTGIDWRAAAADAVRARR